MVQAASEGIDAIGLFRHGHRDDADCRIGKKRKQFLALLVCGQPANNGADDTDLLRIASRLVTEKR